jgi:hypothetical protein
LTADGDANRLPPLRRAPRAAEAGRRGPRRFNRLRREEYDVRSLTLLALTLAEAQAA